MWRSALPVRALFVGFLMACATLPAQSLRVGGFNLTRAGLLSLFDGAGGPSLSGPGSFLRSAILNGASQSGTNVTFVAPVPPSTGTVVAPCLRDSRLVSVRHGDCF